MIIEDSCSQIQPRFQINAHLKKRAPLPYLIRTTIISSAKTPQIKDGVSNSYTMRFSDVHKPSFLNQTSLFHT